MYSKDITKKVLGLLADSYKCDPDDLARPENKFIRKNETGNGNKSFFRMICCGNSTIIMADKVMEEWCSTWLKENEGIYCFDAPQICQLDRELRKHNQTIGEIFEYSLPLKNGEPCGNISDEYELKLYKKGEFDHLYAHKEFDNAITYEKPGNDVIAAAAYKGDILCAVAGASNNQEAMWCVGIDTLPEHRGKGLGSHLIGMLSKEILAKGIIPLYSTWYSNIGSRKTAIACGYSPFFVEINSEPMEV